MILVLMILTMLAVLVFQANKNTSVKSLFSILIGLAASIYINRCKLEKGDLLVCNETKTHQRVVIPSKDRFLHMLILGPTGSGKTSQALLPFINQDLQNTNCGITVLEPKGDLAEKVYALAQLHGRECIYFNVEYEACPSFNPLYGLDIDRIAENLVLCFRALQQQSPDFFKDSCEELLRCAVKVIKQTQGNKATLLTLENFLKDVGGYGHQIIYSLQDITKTTKNIEKKHENNNLIAYFLTEYFNPKNDTYKNASAVRTELSRLNGNKYLRRALNPPDGVSQIDFTKHLKENDIISISTSSGVLGQTLSKLLGLFLMLNFQSAVFQRDGDENSRRPHFLYIDEFQVYANPSFADLLTQGRSYRVASHLATQNRSLISGDGSLEGEIFKELVSANCRNIVLLPDLPPEDTQYYSRVFGEHKVIKSSSSKNKNAGNLVYSSFSDSFSETEEAFITPTDISQRPFGEITYKIVKNNTAQRATHGKVNFLPSELNQNADKIINENRQLLTNGINPQKYRTKNGNLIKPIQKIIEDENAQDNLI